MFRLFNRRRREAESQYAESEFVVARSAGVGVGILLLSISVFMIAMLPYFFGLGPFGSRLWMGKSTTVHVVNTAAEPFRFRLPLQLPRDLDPNSMVTFRSPYSFLHASIYNEDRVLIRRHTVEVAESSAVLFKPWSDCVLVGQYRVPRNPNADSPVEVTVLGRVPYDRYAAYVPDEMAFLGEGEGDALLPTYEFTYFTTPINCRHINETNELLSHMVGERVRRAVGVAAPPETADDR